MDKEEAARMRALEKFMATVASIVECLPSYCDPHPERGNSHIIERLRHLTNQSSRKEPESE